MNKILKWIVGIIVLILVVSGLSFLVGNKNTPADTETGPVKIGFIGPLTGEAAEYGEDARNAISLAAERINDTGGINGRKIEVIYEDGACNGPDSVSAMSKLVNVDKVSLVLGGACSGESLAAVPIADQNKIMLISAISSSPDLTGISDYFVRMIQSDAENSKALAEYVKTVGWNKIAFLHEQTDYVKALFNTFSKDFVSSGRVIIKEEFPSELTDFKTLLLKLKSQNPDALFLGTQGKSSMERIIRQLKEMNWKPQIIFEANSSLETKFIEQNADFLEGTIGVLDPSGTDYPEYKNFISDFVSKYNTEPNVGLFASMEYDAVMLVAKGLSETNMNLQKLPKWFRGVKNYQGASGVITINSEGDRIGSYKPAIVKNGEVVLIEE